MKVHLIRLGSLMALLALGGCVVDGTSFDQEGLSTTPEEPIDSTQQEWYSTDPYDQHGRMLYHAVHTLGSQSYGTAMGMGTEWDIQRHNHIYNGFQTTYTGYSWEGNHWTDNTGAHAAFFTNLYGSRAHSQNHSFLRDGTQSAFSVCTAVYKDILFATEYAIGVLPLTDGPRWFQRATGTATHTIQDSFAPAHARREGNNPTRILDICGIHQDDNVFFVSQVCQHPSSTFSEGDDADDNPGWESNATVATAEYLDAVTDARAVGHLGPVHKFLHKWFDCDELNPGKNYYDVNNKGEIWIGKSNGFQFGGGYKNQYSACYGDQICEVADVSGDGKGDLVVFNHQSKFFPSADAKVTVSMSDGSGFGSPKPAHGYFCTANEICKLADMNKDRKADLVAFDRSTGNVWVAYSNGTAFGNGQLIATNVCTGDQQCELGDVNEDGIADLYAFERGTTARVWVSLSSSTGFRPREVEHDYFCDGKQICKVADVTGDGKPELIAFDRGEASDWGDVWIAKANSRMILTLNGVVWVYTGYSAGQKWHTQFCNGDEVCDVADINGDGKADLLAFERREGGDVYAAPSTGTGFHNPVLFHDYFCAYNEICRTGDIDGDGKADVFALSH